MFDDDIKEDTKITVAEGDDEATETGEGADIEEGTAAVNSEETEEGDDDAKEEEEEGGEEDEEETDEIDAGTLGE